MCLEICKFNLPGINDEMPWGEHFFPPFKSTYNSLPDSFRRSKFKYDKLYTHWHYNILIKKCCPDLFSHHFIVLSNVQCVCLFVYVYDSTLTAVWVWTHSISCQVSLPGSGRIVCTAYTVFAIFFAMLGIDYSVCIFITCIKTIISGVSL